MVVVAIVDSVYASPCRCADRAAPISPAGCIIRVYPVGASTSGSGCTRSSTRAVVSTPVTVGRGAGPASPPPRRPAVSRHRQLLVGAAVDVIKDRPRDQPARRGPQVADVVAGRQPSARAVELDRL